MIKSGKVNYLVKFMLFDQPTRLKPETSHWSGENRIMDLIQRYKINSYCMIVLQKHQPTHRRKKNIKVKYEVTKNILWKKKILTVFTLFNFWKSWFKELLRVEIKQKFMNTKILFLRLGTKWQIKWTVTGQELK